jgi:hypothetical protein
MCILSLGTIGNPIDIAIGFLGVIILGIISMMIAIIGVWFSGWVDGFIQWLTVWLLLQSAGTNQPDDTNQPRFCGLRYCIG